MQENISKHLQRKCWQNYPGRVYWDNDACSM